MDRIIFWFCEKFGERDILRSCGDGSVAEECGWWLFGYWVSAEANRQQPPVSGEGE